jgi:hypothetical protein
VTPTIEQEQAFDTWLLNGTTAPTIESGEHRVELLRAFARGWNDRVAGGRDFKERSSGLPIDAKIAYMTGRLLVPMGQRAPALPWGGFTP